MPRLKYKTNNQIMRKVATDAGDMGLIFARTTLMDKCKEILDNEDELRENWPTNHIVTADYWIAAARQVHEIVKEEGK